MASLEYKQGDRETRLELKTDTEYRIGRDPSCSVCVGEIPKVSRCHCVIYFNSTVNAFALSDLYSTNGTFLNGKKIGYTDVPLHEGDRITVGSVELIYHAGFVPSVETVRTNTEKLPVFPLKQNPLSVSGPLPESKPSRFRPGECLLNHEEIRNLLFSDEQAELYLTRSGESGLHLLKIYRKPLPDPAAGKALKKRVAEIPGIAGTVPVLDCGTLDEGICYQIMNYLEYPSYARMISMLSPLPQIPSLALIHSAALILARSRKSGIFHGNLKPSKILYAPQDGNYMIGMGLSEWKERFFPDQQKQSGQWYASPETLGGRSVWQSDQYALGIMFFQLLTGVLPFWSESPDELAAMHREKTMPLPPERNPQIHTLPALDAVIIRMTMKDPAERYRSWEDLIMDLEKINSMLKKTKDEFA